MNAVQGRARLRWRVAAAVCLWGAVLPAQGHTEALGGEIAALQQDMRRVQQAEGRLTGAALAGFERRYQELRAQALAGSGDWDARTIGAVFYGIGQIGAELGSDLREIVAGLEIGLAELRTRPQPHHGAAPLLARLSAHCYELGGTAPLIGVWEEFVLAWPKAPPHDVKRYWLAVEAARHLTNQCRASGTAERLAAAAVADLRGRAPWSDAERQAVLQDQDLWISYPDRPAAGGYDDCLGHLLLQCAFARNELGRPQSALGDLREAQPHLEAAQNTHRLANVQHHLAAAWLKLGDFDRAEAAATAAIEVYRSGVRPGEAPDTNGLLAMQKVRAELRLRRRRPGDLAAARRLIQEVLDDALRAPFQVTNADACVVLGEILVSGPMGRSEQQEFDSLLRSALDSPHMQNHLGVRARMLQLEAGRRLREGNLELARLALDRAWLAMPAHFDVRLRQQVVRAEVELAAGRPAEALAAIAASREILRRAVESESLWARGGVGTFQALYSEALGVAFRAFQALAAADASAAAAALPTLYDIVQSFHGYEAACLFWVARLPLQVEDLAGSVRSSASAMVARREHLQRTIERLQRARVTPGRMAVDLRAELRRLQAEREAVDGNLALLLAQAGGMVAAPPQATLAEVQRALQPKELLVEFVRTEGRFAAFCIDVAGAELAWLTASPTVEAGLAAFAQARGSGDAAGCDAALADLGDLLPEQGPLGRRLRDAEVVLVSPEGSLGGLPFAALPWGPRGLLGEQVTLGYVASGTVLADLRRRPLRSHGELSQGRLLALANPRYGGNPGHREVVRGGADLSRIGSLPWSAREAVEVARGFASSESETAALAGITDPTRVDATLMGARFRVLLGSHARESALDAGALSGVDFLHLACHGFADPEAAALSFLALTLDDGAPDEGLLRIDEFPKLRGDRELVALSACDTGSGPTVGHEGPASLARAVQAVGARRVLATSWRVDDDEAHRVVTRFYALWLRDGRAAAEALAVAQREARAAGSPTRDWASFSLWGEPR